MLHPQKLIFLISVLISACTSGVRIERPEQDIISKWDSLPSKLRNINACYAAYINTDGHVLEYYQGKNTNSDPINQYTLFEGASLSKTVFAYLYWDLLEKQMIERTPLVLKTCGTTSPAIISPFSLLKHSVPCRDSCVDTSKPMYTFSYSENGYLLLQKSIEKQMHDNLENLATNHVFGVADMKGASFVWHDSTQNFVNGFYENEKFHRHIYRLKKPASNGSLYIHGADLVKFARMLMHSAQLDSMNLNTVAVPGFDRLSWGRGIGKEWNKNTEYVWQWGSNWSFNHILLIDRTHNTAFICLSNSMIGAKRIMETSNWLFNTHFQLFDYTGWY